MSARWGKVPPTVALDSAAAAREHRRSPLSACRSGSLVMTKSLVVFDAPPAARRRRVARPVPPRCGRRGPRCRGARAGRGRLADAGRAVARSAPQLAGVYAGQVDPALLLREREVRRRARALGRPRPAPPQRPRRCRRRRRSSPRLPAAPLDGELWLGRGRFDALSARSCAAPSRDERDWRAGALHGVRHAGRRRRRSRRGSSAGWRSRRSCRAPVEVAPQWRVADRAELERALGANGRRRRRRTDAARRRRRLRAPAAATRC